MSCMLQVHIETSQLISSNSYLTSFYKGFSRVENVRLKVVIGKTWVTDISLMLFLYFLVNVFFVVDRLVILALHRQIVISRYNIYIIFSKLAVYCLEHKNLSW